MYLAKKYWSQSENATNFKPLVAPPTFTKHSQYADFGCSVDLYAKFMHYKAMAAHVNNIVFACELATSTTSVTMSTSGNTYYYWGETNGGIDVTNYAAMGTAPIFTANSTKRWYVKFSTGIRALVRTMPIYMGTSPVWLFLGSTVTRIEGGTESANSTLKYVFTEEESLINMYGAFYGNTALGSCFYPPKTLKTIEYFCFLNCLSLTCDIVLPSGFTSLMRSAFQGCINLKGTLTLPSTITTIEYRALRQVGFTRINSYINDVSNTTLFDVNAFEAVTTSVPFHIPIAGTGYQTTWGTLSTAGTKLTNFINDL